MSQVGRLPDGPGFDAPNANAAGVSALGTDLVADTDARTGRWCAITAITETVISALTLDASLSPVSTGSWAARTIVAGTSIVVGPFTGVTLTSGVCVLHRFNPSAA